MTTFNQLVDLMYSIQDKSVLEDLLMGLTTHKERIELAQRIAIIEKLLNKEPQKMISKDLGVGIATVTRGSKELAQGRFKVLREKNAQSK